MKKSILTYLIICVLKLSGQINPTVKNIFYNLPLDKSRKDIHDAIISDKRFKSTRTDTSYLMKLFTPFIGLSNDNGVVKAKPDSIEIELTYGFGQFPAKKKHSKSNFTTHLILRYFYSSSDRVEKEFKNVLNILSPIIKDSAHTGIDTVYSDHAIQRELKVKGTIFKNYKPKYSIRILNASPTKNYYGLFIEFEREDE